MKYRLLQPLLLLGILIGILLYCLGMIITWPIFFLGSLFWKYETMIRMLDFFFNHIPNIPEFE